MSFIFSWSTENRLIIAADTVASDSGKPGKPPIKIDVNKIYPISEGIVGISIGTDHFDYRIDSNDTVKMIFEKAKNKEISEAKNLIKTELQQAFIRYKAIKEQKHEKTFTEIEPTEITLLRWIREFNFFGCETIEVGVKSGKIYSTSWLEKN